MLDIFVNTWGNYNENGADGGEWITLPMEEESLKERLARIAEAMGDIDPEWTIHDYEWTTEIELDEVSEYDNIFDLNEKCTELDSLEEWEAEEIAAAVEAYGYTFAEAFERQQRGCFIFYKGMDMEEVAEELIDECYDIPEFALRYFDYSAFARDLGFDGYTETKYGVICDN
jgi:antirestriction protein